MEDTKTLLEELIKWRISFWFCVALMTVIPFFMYYFDEKIGDLKTKITLINQNEKKIISLVNELVKYPSNYDLIFRQIEVLEVPSNLYPKFREAVPIINKFCEENYQINGPNYEDLHNRLIPLLLEKLPDQVYSDVTLDYEFKNRTQLYYINTQKRKKLIKPLYDAIIKSSITKHKYAVRGMIFDLFWENPELLVEFKRVFGQEKIEEIKKLNLWSGEDLKNLANECRNGLIEFGVIDSKLNY